MRIDGTQPPQGSEHHPIHEGAGTSNRPRPDRPARDVASQNPSTASPNSLLPYLRRVQASPEVNSQAVNEALRLLRSGELDSAEAARRAAEALLDYGI